MGTTLTREQLLEKGKGRYEEVEIEGLGVVGIRDISNFRRSHRASMMIDDNGKVLKDQWNRREAYAVIDQVMIDETTPMFKPEDIDAVSDLTPAVMDLLMGAINRFNGEDEVAEKKDEPAA